MIVQCEQCRTKFRLDDEKVTDRGVKVRCAKCRHVFTVRKEEPVQELAAAPETAPVHSFVPESASSPSLDDVWAPSMEAPAEKTVFMTATPAVVPETQPAPEADTAFDFGTTPLDPPGPAADFGEISFGETSGAFSADSPDDFDLKQTDAAAGGIDFGDLSFASEPAASADPQSDFGEMTMVMPPKQPEFQAPEKQLAATSSDQDPLPVDSPFDFNDLPEDQAFSLDQPALSDAATESLQPPVNEAPPEDNFSMGDIDFGAPADTAAEDTFKQAPPAVANTLAVEKEPEITFDAAPAQQEAPPLSITSRRRQSSLLSILIAVLVALVLGVGGFMAYTSLTNGSGASELFGKPAAPVEEGRIFIQKVSAHYVQNTISGELLVITGEAVNKYSTPRAALQVKGIVFGAGGNILVSKVAYVGNQLSDEQMATMELEKIEAAMNNQFGDSLINLEVPPGKAIPFAIVIANPPKEGKEFGVEAAGSTVSAGK